MIDKRKPTSVLWDLENCGVPPDVKINTIKNNLNRFLSIQNLFIDDFTAYSSSVHALRKSMLKELLISGININTEKSSKKNAIDMQIIYKIAELIQTNITAIVLISGDSDFSEVLKLLKKNNICSILVHLSSASFNFINCSDISILWSDILEYNDSIHTQMIFHHGIYGYSEEEYSSGDDTDVYDDNISHLNNICIIEFLNKNKTIIQCYIPIDIKLQIGNLVEVGSYTYPGQAYPIARVIKLIYNPTHFNDMYVKKVITYANKKTYKELTAYNTQLTENIKREKNLRYPNLNIVIQYAEIDDKKKIIIHYSYPDNSEQYNKNDIVNCENYLSSLFKASTSFEIV